MAAVLALAVLLRLAHWWAVREEPFVGSQVVDSQEYDRWAQEIAAGDWLGEEPFFQAPLYPYFLAAVYTLFGHRYDAVYLLQIGLAAIGCWALYRAGRRISGPRLGIAAAALAAVYGPFLFYDVQLLKESLAVTAAAFLLWFLAAAREAERPAGWWLGVGLVSGVMALLRENMLLVFPLLLLLALGWGRRRAVAGMALATAGLVLVLAPVALRNAWAGGGFLPTTFQGGTNFYIGNHPGADGTYQPIAPGKQIPYFERREPVRIAEAELGRPLSGAEVSRYWLGRSLAWARAEPGAFLRLQVRKLGLFWSWYEWPDAVDYYWLRERSPVLGMPLLELGAVVLLALGGLWLVRRRLGPFLPVLVFAAGWTASTVIFFIFSRYRLPVVPALLLLAAVPAVAAAEALARGERRAGLALAAACVAAWAAPHALGFGPRMDLVHYNLARLDDEAGRPEEAARHYRQALEVNPRDFLAAMNLGTGAARQRRWEEARKWLQRAAEIEPRSDDAQANLGTVYLALGDLDRAAEHLDRALALNAGHPQALHNREILERRLEAREREGGAPPAGGREGTEAGPGAGAAPGSRRGEEETPASGPGEGEAPATESEGGAGRP